LRRHPSFRARLRLRIVGVRSALELAATRTALEVSTLIIATATLAPDAEFAAATRGLLRLAARFADIRTVGTVATVASKLGSLLLGIARTAKRLALAILARSSGERFAVTILATGAALARRTPAPAGAAAAGPTLPSASTYRHRCISMRSAPQVTASRSPRISREIGWRVPFWQRPSM
jgi:hypothetical protein